jgi:5'-nucleotidase
MSAHSFDGWPAGGPPHRRDVFVNRTLNLQRIEVIGYDMDYTLVGYHAAEWEARAYNYLKENLIEHGWDSGAVAHLTFDPQRVIRGTVLDCTQGNLLKVNRFGFIKQAYHGTTRLSAEQVRSMYNSPVVDLNDAHMVVLDTLFSLSEGCIFAQIVDIFDDEGLPEVYDYVGIWEVVRRSLDLAHIEGELKRDVLREPARYVVADNLVAQTLLDQKLAGKRLVLITNSEWSYTNPVMAHAFDPYLPTGMTWRDLFSVIVVESRKPGFFRGRHRMLQIHDEVGAELSPFTAPLEEGGVYLGGDAESLETLLGVAGDSILYVGDHIYGDVIVSKRLQQWRTCLILPELEDEVQALQDHRAAQARINQLMEQKEAQEARLNQANVAEITGAKGDQGNWANIALEASEAIAAVDAELGQLLTSMSSGKNPYWGELMRAGNDESLLASQVERFACLYTSRVSNLGFHTPNRYYRAPRSILPHDPDVAHWADQED